MFLKISIFDQSLHHAPLCNINILEEIGQKPQKTPVCHHMQCIFDPKRAKTAKTRFFPEFSLGDFLYSPEIKFKYAKLRRSYE